MFLNEEVGYKKGHPVVNVEMRAYLGSSEKLIYKFYHYALISFLGLGFAFG